MLTEAQQIRQPVSHCWKCKLELDTNRQRVSGSEADLCQQIRRGADLRVGTGFRHNEHVDVNSPCNEEIHEFCDFRITYLLGDRWTAGICNLRMPVQLPDSFGPRESMSFCLYNQNAQQAIARPYLDGATLSQPSSAEELGMPNRRDIEQMARYKEIDRQDVGSNAPCSNFIYDFDFYRYLVADRWTEVFSHDSDGAATGGSFTDLVAAFHAGAELKVAINGLCSDLNESGQDLLSHEVFVHLGACYYYTESRLLISTSHPVVRVRPSIPLIYQSRGWDFGWLLPRTDGYVARWLCDPYTLKFRKNFARHAMRWFAG